MFDDMFSCTFKHSDTISKSGGNQCAKLIERLLLTLFCSLQMLSIGVDRVVDQVITPKVISEFKPQIDRVICEYLGVDYDKWMERQSA